MMNDDAMDLLLAWIDEEIVDWDDTMREAALANQPTIKLYGQGRVEALEDVKKWLVRHRADNKSEQ